MTEAELREWKNSGKLSAEDEALVKITDDAESLAKVVALINVSNLYKMTEILTNNNGTYRRPIIWTWQAWCSSAPNPFPNLLRVGLNLKLTGDDLTGYFFSAKTPDQMCEFLGVDGDFTDEEIAQAKAPHPWLKDVTLPKKKEKSVASGQPAVAAPPQ